MRNAAGFSSTFFPLPASRHAHALIKKKKGMHMLPKLGLPANRVILAMPEPRRPQHLAYSCLLACAKLAHTCGHQCLALPETHRATILTKTHPTLASTCTRRHLCASRWLGLHSLIVSPPHLLAPTPHPWSPHLNIRGLVWLHTNTPPPKGGMEADDNMTGREEGCLRPFNLFGLDPSYIY